MLLLEPPERLLAQLPGDSTTSPALRQLIAEANPQRSFEQIARALDVPWSHLSRLAAHLRYWRKAAVVDTVSKHNVYVIHPHATLDLGSPVVREFELEFGAQQRLSSSSSANGGTALSAGGGGSSSTSAAAAGLSLPELLSRFTVPRALADQVASAGSEARGSDESNPKQPSEHHSRFFNHRLIFQNTPQ